MRAKDAVGKYGERIAAQHLREAGLSIIDSNWRCELGEIDIVAVEGSTLVLCEVKTRTTVLLLAFYRLDDLLEQHHGQGQCREGGNPVEDSQPDRCLSKRLRRTADG